MPKKILFIAFLLTSFFCFSQNSIKIKGKILDKKTNLPLESATVYLSSVADSAVIDYTITNKIGAFEMTTKKITKPVFLKVSFMGFKTYQIQKKEILENIDFGVLSLDEDGNLLGEVVVKSEAPPIRIKKDTLEFNASSFKVRPDANVETLLKQLPGLEIDADGKITVNGKEVNQVLVNGKPFFDKDGKIALQNLPSNIINKVQVTDTKTKKEEKTGQAASSNNASLNLTIDEDKNKGFFGKVMGGYGTNDRYESSGLANYFKNKTKVSVLASSNNINSTGFSMDEIFDNMGGGRSSSVWMSNDGSFSINGRRFGGNNGITQTNMVGINYSDEWAKDLESTSNYFFSNTNSENVNKTSQTNLLPSGNFTTNSNTISNDERHGHNFNFDIEYKIDSTASIIIEPKFSKAKSNYRNSSNQVSTDNLNQLLNESVSEDYGEADANNFSNTLTFTKSFKRKGRFLSSSFYNENNKSEEESFTKSNTIFYQGGGADDTRNQFSNSNNSQDKYSIDLEYSEPITDSLSVRFGTDLLYDRNKEVLSTFDFDSFVNDYVTINDLLSREFSSFNSTITGRTGVEYKRKKLQTNFNFGTTVMKTSNHAFYLNSITDLKKEFIVPFMNATISYNFSKSKSIRLSYYFNPELPSASQILPVEDLSNSLNTLIGNPNLDVEKNHTVYFNFRNYDFSTRSGHGFYSGGNFYENRIVSSTIFDVDKKRTTTFNNVSGTLDSWLGFYFDKTIKKDVHTFKFGLRLHNGLAVNKGFTDGIQYEANTLTISPRANITYEYGELFTINPSYNYSFNKTDYNNYVVNSASNFIHKFNVQVTNYWPKNWVFGNDFGYTYNSNIADGFKKDFYLWNTSLSYSFFDKKFTAKVKVYDVLNQNVSSVRRISETSIRDEQNIVLKRYAMFSLTYKLERFAGKEKKEKRMFMW